MPMVFSLSMYDVCQWFSIVCFCVCVYIYWSERSNQNQNQNQSQMRRVSHSMLALWLLLPRSILELLSSRNCQPFNWQANIAHIHTLSLSMCISNQLKTCTFGIRPMDRQRYRDHRLRDKVQDGQKINQQNHPKIYRNLSYTCNRIDSAWLTSLCISEAVFFWECVCIYMDWNRQIEPALIPPAHSSVNNRKMFAISKNFIHKLTREKTHQTSCIYTIILYTI